MDCRRTFLIALLYSLTGLILWIAQVSSAYAADTQYREPLAKHWFQDSSAFTQRANRAFSECTATPNDTQTLLGRLAFNSPRLLGGQAARMGLSCASCHPSGRANPDFFIQQISSTPGTSDITHSFFSSAGGDSQFNPRPIPDLAQATGLRFPDRHVKSFTSFLHKLIEVEFDGRPAPAQVFQALLHYLQKTSHRHCSSADQVDTRFTQDWRLIENALTLLMATELSTASKRFIIQSARAQLEVIFYNYGLTPQPKIDQLLISLSRDLEQLAAQDYAKTLLDEPLKKAKALEHALRAHHGTSAYSPKALSQHITPFQQALNNSQ